VATPVEMLGALLDRSIEGIAEASRDARTYDRGRIVQLSDVWDNSTFPLIATVCANPLWRNRRARTGLRWMALIEEQTVFRDHRGTVHPVASDLTRMQIEKLDADYDIAGGTVRTVSVEATRDGLLGHVTVKVARRYESEAPGTARLAVDLAGITGLRFDMADRRGCTLSVSENGLTVGLGERGFLIAETADVYPDDDTWHLSIAGRSAATATAPWRRERPLRPVPTRWIPDAAYEAGMVLHKAMRAMRRVLHRPLAPEIPVYEQCQALSGAGRALVEAGGLCCSRTKAFEDLTRTWRERGAETEWREPVSIADGPALVRCASYSAGTATVLAAVPAPDADAPWLLAGRTVEEPDEYSVDLAPFLQPATVGTQDGRLTIGSGLTLR
jgi:hypothetical protein